MLNRILMALGLRRRPTTYQRYGRYGRYGALLPIAYLGWQNRDRISSWWRQRRTNPGAPRGMVTPRY